MTEEKKHSFRDKLKRQFSWKHLIGLAVGLVGGYIYYRTVGCASGACPITSNPWLTLIWGGIIGYLLADMVPYPKKKQSEPPQQNQP
jgi:hypothetical protein